MNDLTKGSVFGTIVKFSLPYFAAYFLQTFYGLADLFITGQFCGADTITAVAGGSQLMHFVTVVIVGLAVGTTVMIAHEVGRSSSNKTHEHAQINKIIGNTVTVFAAAAAAMTAVLLFSARGIVGIMQTPPEAKAGMLTYITICFAGIPFITAYNVIAAVFRGLGDSRTPMYFVGIACILNIGLDYLLIGGLSMGAEGAAFATVTAQTVSVILSLIWIHYNNRHAVQAAADPNGAVEEIQSDVSKQDRGIRVTKADIKPDRDIIMGFVRIGLPIAFQDGFIQVSFLVITAIANSRGVEIAAAVGIVEKMITFLFLVPSSMLSTISSVGAQAVGAELYGRARKVLFTGMAIACSVGMVFAVSFQFISEEVLSAFTSDADVISFGSQYIRAYIIDCVLASIHFCFSGYFSCIGMSVWSFIHNAVSIVCVRIPGAYMASKLFPDNLFPMGLAAPMGSLLSAVICVCVYIYIQSHTVYGGDDRSE
ncbi:MAG: MATE family efflux transporter [Eubacterium sp.]|nr:MATE family efflux transporter [Eubacterium sp.]